MSPNENPLQLTFAELDVTELKETLPFEGALGYLVVAVKLTASLQTPLFSFETIIESVSRIRV